MNWETIVDKRRRLFSPLLSQVVVVFSAKIFCEILRILCLTSREKRIIEALLFAPSLTIIFWFLPQLSRP